MSDLPEFIPDSEDAAPIIDERSLARRIALQALYEIDLANHPADAVLAIQLKAQTPSRKVSRYVQELVYGVLEHQAVLNDTIRLYAPEWPLDQIAAIDRNILRIAIYEFAVRARTPIGVAIDEAVELAKMFGADGASSFINGVLGAVADDNEWLQKIRDMESDEDGDQTPASSD